MLCKHEQASPHEAPDYGAHVVQSELASYRQTPDRLHTDTMHFGNVHVLTPLPLHPCQVTAKSHSRLHILVTCPSGRPAGLGAICRPIELSFPHRCTCKMQGEQRKCIYKMYIHDRTPQTFCDDEYIQECHGHCLTLGTDHTEILKKRNKTMVSD